MRNENRDVFTSLKCLVLFTAKNYISNISYYIIITLYWSNDIATYLNNFTYILFMCFYKIHTYIQDRVVDVTK